MATIKTMTKTKIMIKRGLTVRYIHCKNDFNDLQHDHNLLPLTTNQPDDEEEEMTTMINSHRLWWRRNHEHNTIPISLTSWLQHSKKCKDNIM